MTIYMNIVCSNFDISHLHTLSSPQVEKTSCRRAEDKGASLYSVILFLRGMLAFKICSDI